MAQDRVLVALGLVLVLAAGAGGRRDEGAGTIKRCRYSNARYGLVQHPPPRAGAEVGIMAAGNGRVVGDGRDEARAAM